MSLKTRTLVEASQTLGAAFLAGLRSHAWGQPRRGGAVVELAGLAGGSPAA
jgi:hypothetical protein